MHSTPLDLTLTDEMRFAIVGAARSQLNVSYHHDAYCPGVGFDCVGLVKYAYNQVIPGIVPDDVDINLGNIVGFLDDRISKGFEQFGFVKELNPSALLPGDPVLWDYTGSNIHTGMITEAATKNTPPKVIHSCATFGRVTEHYLIGEWGVGRRFKWGFVRTQRIPSAANFLSRSLINPSSALT
jgi:uncharacterized protein YijF (DUF1287 family)